MNWLAVAAVAVWAMLPAYVPNNVAVLAGGGRPIDGGRTWGGRRVLGDGKTWRGTFLGVLAGAALAALLNLLRPTLAAAVGATPGDFLLPAFPPAAMLALPAGAMLGDVLASFLKRRTGRERGAAFPLLDQLDFVVGALALAALAAPGWFRATFTPPVVLVVLVATPILHLLTNGIAYLLGLKDEPW